MFKEDNEVGLYDAGIGDSDGEGQVDSFPEEFGDLVYENEAGESTEATVSSWVKNELVPKILDRCVREIPNTPRPGVVFKDLVGSLLLQPFGLSLCCGMVADFIHGRCDSIPRRSLLCVCWSFRR